MESGIPVGRCPKCAEKNDRDSVRIEKFELVIQESVCSFVFEGENINHTRFSIVYTSHTPHCRPFAPWPHLHTSSRVFLLAGPQCNGCSVLPFTVHQIKCPMHLHNKGTPISSHDGQMCGGRSQGHLEGGGPSGRAGEELLGFFFYNPPCCIGPLECLGVLPPPFRARR